DESLNLLRQPPESETPSGGTPGEDYTVPAWASITLQEGIVYTFKAHTDNTGACTVGDGGSPDYSIKLISGSDPVAGQIKEGGVYSLLVVGAELILLNPVSGSDIHTGLTGHISG